MELHERLAAGESWSPVDDVLGEAVENYAEKEDLSLQIGYENTRTYKLELGNDELVFSIHRSSRDVSSTEENRIGKSYSLEIESGPEELFESLRTDFMKVSRPDAIEGNTSWFYEDVEGSVFEVDDKWDYVDSNDVMSLAAEKYNEKVPEDPITVSMKYEHEEGTRIYEVGIENSEVPLMIKMKPREHGFAVSLENEGLNMKYKNFMRYGFSEALSELSPEENS